MPGTDWDLLVRRDDPATAEARPAPDAARPLGEGEIRLRVEAFALSANNLTYAVTGDSLGYWKLFPAPDGWGRIPAWGYATVVHSRSPGLEPGRRFFGMMPMSSGFVARARANTTGFVETSDARGEVDRVYNRYSGVDGRTAPSLEWECALRPVFLLSFVLSEHLGDETGEIIVTSASSKAALGVAHLMAGRTVIGLTSPANRGFVEGTGLYTGVVPYPDAKDLPGRSPSVLLDFAGDRRIIDVVRDRYGPSLTRVVRVGRTRWEQPGETLDTAREDFFFAPAHIQRLVSRWGAAAFEERFASSLRAFTGTAGHQVALSHVDGPDALLSAYRALSGGRVDPRTSLIARPAGPVPDRVPVRGLTPADRRE